MQKIRPFLWFHDNALEAVSFYVSVFKDSKIVSVTHYSDAAANASGRPKGSVMTVDFELYGEKLTALNGGPVFTFSPAISLMVNCDTQEELDELWEKLSAGGETLECGWLTDKYGVTWQIVPTALSEMLKDADPGQLDRVMTALIQMTKLDINALRQAYGKE